MEAELDGFDRDGPEILKLKYNGALAVEKLAGEGGSGK